MMPYRNPQQMQYIDQLRKRAIIALVYALKRLPETFNKEQLESAIRAECGQDGELFVECCIVFAACASQSAKAG